MRRCVSCDALSEATKYSIFKSCDVPMLLTHASIGDRVLRSPSKRICFRPAAVAVCWRRAQYFRQDFLHMDQPNPYSRIQKASWFWPNPSTLQPYESRFYKAKNDWSLFAARQVHNHYFISHALTIIANPETKMSLPSALLKCLNQKFYEAIPSRLFLIVFRYSQPILIQETITYATAYSADEQSNRGYWLIVSAITIYTGLAVSRLCCYGSSPWSCN